MIGKTISHYKIIEKLGEGGMGAVYKAEDTKLDRFVALKFLPSHLGEAEEEKKRFIHEAKAASALDHPNICTIHEINETEDGQMFIAMGCYEGKSLKEKIQKAGANDGSALSIKDAIDFTIQIAEGLRMAHAKEIVHRDIKPANIMFTSDNTVKIVDFGLAKVARSPRLTKSGVTMGTVAYMSPEQAQGVAVGHRTDIWALAVVLYEMLTGQLPFKSDYEQVIIYAILFDEPDSVRDLREDVPAELDEVISKALTKDQENRYDSIESMIQDLKKVLDSDSISAKRKPTQRSTPQETASSPLLRAERRQATIVLSNLVGYVAMVEQLAPEDVEEVMKEIKDAATEIVNSHGGVVNQFADDELVALFGISASHEDDFARAVRMALALHARVRELSIEVEGRTGQPIRLSTGISSGLVVAQLSNKSDRQFEITGNAVQIATRLADMAEADKVLVSPEGQRLTASFFETKAQEPIFLKGKTQQITPYCVLGESGLQTRLEAAERVGLTTYVGRERELKLLRGCLENVQRGEGQLLTVVGEAGVGKSRLLYEFRLGLDLDSVRLLQGRCQSHSGSTPYRPFIETLRDILLLSEDEERASLPEAVVARIQKIDPHLEDFIPLYLDLLSIENEAYPFPEHLKGEDFRVAMLEALSAIFTLSTKSGPVVMLLEDWHWADETTEEVLSQLVEMVPAYPLLVGVTYRPEYPKNWRNLAHHTPIHLGPMEASSSLAIIKSVLGVKSLPEDLAKLVFEKTGGNPFFLEEVCQTLLQEGTLKVEKGRGVLTQSLRKLHLPDTVQAVIQTRLDRLHSDAKEVLLFGAVIGSEFPRKILQRSFTDDTQLRKSLDTLKALGLIQQLSVAPEAIYKFKHILTQEVAYACLLKHQRKPMHGLIGEAIEELYPERIEEHVEQLAHHFCHAEIWRKAIQYGQQAAKKAKGLSQFKEALKLLERVHEWLLKLPEDNKRRETLIDILLQQERLCETLGERERQQRIIDELLSLLEITKDRAKLVDVYRRQGELFTILGRFDSAEPVLRDSLRISRELSDAGEERNTLRSLGFLDWQRGANQAAVANNEAALSISRQLGEKIAIAGDLTNLGNVLRRSGDLKGALKCAEEALEIADEISDPVRQVVALHLAGTVHGHLGDNNRAASSMERGLEICREHRLLLHQTILLNLIGNIFRQQGKHEESLEFHKEALNLSRKCNYADGLAQSLRMVGETLISMDRHSEALPYLQEGTTLFAQLENFQSECLLWRKIGTVYEREGKYSQSVTAWGKVRGLCQKAKDGPGELEALEGMACMTRQQANDFSRAGKYYLEALKIAERLGEQNKQGELLNAIGILEWQRGKFGEALSYYERAFEIFRELGDPVHSGLILNSMGVTLTKLKRHDEALKRLEEAFELHCETKEMVLQGHALAAMAEVHEDMGRPEQALRHYEMSLDIRQQIDDRRGEGWMSYHVARIHISQGARDKASDHLSQASNIAEEYGDNKLQDLCRELRKSSNKRRN
jgi:serine/threonine protein kinase/tetratricopeptide (TPR) repeat protein